MFGGFDMPGTGTGITYVMYQMHFLSAFASCSPAAAIIFSRFRLRVTQEAPVRYGAPFGFRSISVGSALDVQGRGSRLFFKGLRFAAPSLVGPWKPTLSYFRHVVPGILYLYITPLFKLLSFVTATIQKRPRFKLFPL